MKRGVILQNRKLKIPSEVVYILAVALLSLAVAMLTAANFGVSMIVAPAYLRRGARSLAVHPVL